MFPVAIHERFGEERIFFGSHPVCHRGARILVRRKLRDWCSEAGGWLWLFSFLIRRFCFAAAMENYFFACFPSGLAADPREESGKAIIVLLAPLFIRMMMALRALETHPEEKLGSIFEF